MAEQEQDQESEARIARIRAEADQQKAGLIEMAGCLVAFYRTLTDAKVPAVHALELTQTLLVESMADYE